MLRPGLSTIRQRWLGRLGEAIASAFASSFSWGGYTVGSKGTAPHSMIADQPYGAATPGNPRGAPLPSAVWTLWDRMLRCWTRLPPGEAGPAFGIRADGRSAKAIQYGIGKGYNQGVTSVKVGDRVVLPFTVRKWGSSEC